jgi:hypothetical protein
MRYLDSFLDNWLLPLSLAVVSGWIAIRQQFIFSEHKDMLARLSKLEINEAVIESQLNAMAENQKEIKQDVKETLEILKAVQIVQAKHE